MTGAAVKEDLLFIFKKTQIKTTTGKPLWSLTACICAVPGILIAAANSINVL